jgi:hypothetical protein
MRKGLRMMLWCRLLVRCWFMSGGHILAVPLAGLLGLVAVAFPPRHRSGIWKTCSWRCRCLTGMVFIYLLVGVD